MKQLKSIDYGIISELVKNSRLSDRQLARILKTSQPTITRRRKMLDDEGLLEYTAIPDLKKLGFEILAFTFGKWNMQEYPDTRVEEMRDFISKHPNIIFISTGRGSGWDRIGISVHKNYSDYYKVMQEYKGTFGKNFSAFESFVVSLNSDNVLRNLSFKYVVSLLQEKEDQ